jgi:hypothetical protein
MTWARTPAIQKLTPEEMKDRSERRLWFNCDEKFRPGHWCAKLFWLEACGDDEEPVEEEVLTNNGRVSIVFFPLLPLRKGNPKKGGVFRGKGHKADKKEEEEE